MLRGARTVVSVSPLWRKSFAASQFSACSLERLSRCSVGGALQLSLPHRSLIIWHPGSHRHVSTSTGVSAALDMSEPQPQREKYRWSKNSMSTLHRRLRGFARNADVKRLAIDAGLNPADWNTATASFRRFLFRDALFFFKDESEIDLFVDQLQQLTTSTSGKLLYPHFIKFCQANEYLPDDDKLKQLSYSVLHELTDLRLPHEYYPKALAMKRRIIYHEGPTNSGKTYQALERLKQAKEENGGGLYCGPLRLLALEIYERLNLDGIYTSLITGQEKKILPCATHVSCTVEMANINRRWDVAVIDEIQLIGDPQRGWAWTRALFGLQAQEIHVCGSGEALELVRKFANTTGDDFEVRSYERRSPLTIADKALKSYKAIEPGDAVVAFSRKDIFAIKKQIEMLTGLKCCIVYGQLPPETRSQQARLFNEQDNEYKVLVASDAIGMGLNLNIRRVVFDAVRKYNGTQGGMVEITPSLTKQIAGRAGRYGGVFPEGLATCLHETDRKYMHEAYHEAPTQLRSAGLFPSSDQMEEFAKQLPGMTDLGDLIDTYVAMARLDGSYFLCNHRDMKEAASFIRHVPMSLSERFTFCMAPISLRNPLARRLFIDYAEAHAGSKVVKLDISLPRMAPRTPERLRDVEIKAQIIDLYLWLSFRFEETFVQNDLALEKKAEVLELVEQGLLNTTFSQSSSKPVGSHWKQQFHRANHRGRHNQETKDRETKRKAPKSEQESRADLMSWYHALLNGSK